MKQTKNIVIQLQLELVRLTAIPLAPAGPAGPEGP